MFLTLTASGLAEGFMAKELVARETILETVRPFWLVRAVTGTAILAGFACLLVNMTMTALRGKAEHLDQDYAPYESIEEEVAVGTV